MKRRTFIKTTGAWGLGSALPWTVPEARATRQREFPQQRSSDRMLYPRPRDGAQVNITPVGLAWLPFPDAAGYRVEIFASNGRLTYEKELNRDPVHLPDRVLPAGIYTWDVAALDKQGAVLVRRGRQSFTITEGAAQLPWVDPKVLVSRVSRERPRILFPAAHLAEVRASLHTSVHLACAEGLTLSQTDQFDTSYNQGIPEAYHREKANHWHVTAETNSDSKISRIAAVMSVTNSRDRVEIQLQNLPGWLGVHAQGRSGRTAGWIRTDDGRRRPKDIPNDSIKLWGRDRDGGTFAV